MKIQKDFREALLQARATSDYSYLTELLPYARKIGMSCQSLGDDALFVLPENRDNTGNPVLPALHGGVLGGFMEMSAAIHLMLFMDEPKIPKIVDFSIDYLRSAKIQDVFAECDVVRQGSRIANVAITAWQSRRETPVATARAHFRLDSL
ncbi:PaaI family thioesterase [Endozoicomonas sp. 8E]|uniref:PaaI family thioesterase n=1 Tax=Endozoicomonas sp. 8E TaxID=3035692 RepID=UPI002939496E|nr:PaaI family thioesterase [Endozoicomonas sp. 8E]WOG25843.1 PaaI family thioesterase [Endozoicomonas sp. 8E]